MTPSPVVGHRRLCFRVARWFDQDCAARDAAAVDLPGVGCLDLGV